MYGGLKSKTYRLFRKLIDLFEVSIELPLLFGKAYVGKKKKGENVGLSQHVVTHDLGELFSEAKKHNIPGIVLLFDECDLLAQNETLLQKLRNVFQGVDGYMLVFSGTEKLFPTLSQVFSPIPRFFKRIDVGNFKNVTETRECILKPLSKDEKKLVDNNSIFEIHSFTGGSPYEVNLVAHYMYKRYKESGIKCIKLTVEVLDDVLEELERLRAKGHHEIASKIRRCWVPHLKILIALLEFGRCDIKSLARYMLLEELHSLTPKKAVDVASINEENIKILIERDLIGVTEEGKLFFKGDQFDLLYLKYFALANGIPKFFVGLSTEPIMNLHHKLQGIFCQDIAEYEFMAMFDKTEIIPRIGKGRLFVGGIYGTFQKGETRTLLSDEIHKRFYLGSEKSLRFRVNVEYLKTGFVVQVTFTSKEDKKLVEYRVKSLMNKLELAGIKILLDDEISWNNKGAELLRKGKFADSIPMFDKAIEINPMFELPWLNKARALFYMKKYDEALECCEKTLNIRPNFSEAWELKGRILFHMKDYNAALPCFKRAVEIDPENWLAWDNQGRTLFNLERYKEAIICFDKVLEDKPDNVDVLRLKAIALMRIGLFKVAARSWNAILEVRPENIEALEAKGICLLQSGRLEESIESFNEVLKYDPGNVSALYNKACALSRSNKVDVALKCLEKAILIDKNVAQQAREDHDFNNIRENPIFKKLTENVV